MADTATKEQIDEIGTLVKAAKTALVTTTTSDGALVSRPMAVQEVEFDGDLWFFTQDPSPKVDEIRANAEVNAAFESGKGYLSVAGTAEIVHDAEQVDRLWSKSVEAWFPEGKSDPSVALIRIAAHTAEYWALGDPKPVMMLKVARAAVAGGTPDVGENRTVEL